MPHILGQVINSFVFRRTGDDGLNWDSSDLGYWNGAGFLICKLLVEFIKVNQAAIVIFQ